jgi:tyrosine-protein kinase Etk/Wzc
MNHHLPFTPPPARAPDVAINFGRLLGVLVAERLMIALIAALSIGLGVAYALFARPVYQADILIQVEDSSNRAKSLLGDVSNLFDVKAEAEGEIEILRSRLVVGKAVENLQLYVEAEPKYFPLIGRWLAGRNKRLSEPGLLGFGGYAWGKEAIRIAAFNVPAELEGKRFTLTALGDERYRLEQSDLDRSIEGRVGEVVKMDLPSGPIQLQVMELNGKAGAAFSLKRNSALKTLTDLQHRLGIGGRGKQSGVIGVSLEGTDPKLTALIVNTIAQEYVDQNSKRKTAEAEKSLAFLGDLLPKLKNELEASESRYNAMRNLRGTFDLSEEVKAYLQENVSAEATLQGLKQKRTVLLSHFTPNHPEVIVIDQQIAALTAKIGSVANRIKGLPNVEQETLRLMREVKVNNELYVGLLNNLQQLKLVTAGKVSNVRLVDSAVVPEEPIKPKRATIVALSALLGLMLGVLVAFIRYLLHGGVTDPEDIERQTGLNVYVSVPLSPAQACLSAELRSSATGNCVLASRYPSEPAVESLRNLRTALQYAVKDAANNRILLTGATPGVGKTFVSANLATVMASGGRRVLLVDADLRKGYLDQYFGRQRGPGLAELVAGCAIVDEVIQRNVANGVDLISTGMMSSDSAELLPGERMAQLLNLFSERYDLVLIDTPPLLGFSDTGNLAANCGTVFLVTRAQQTTIGEVLVAMKQLARVKADISGVIFNGLDPNAFHFGYGAKYGAYRYMP